MTPTFLITGGSGFIGTWVLKELLSRKYRVVVFDAMPGGETWRKALGSAVEEIVFVRGDITNGEALGKVFEAHSITHVIHLAAWLTPMCQQNPVLGCEINVMGTTRLFDVIRTQGKQVKGFSYASSIAVYGRDVEEGTVEKVGEPALEPLTFYGAFKRANEMIAEQFWRHFALPSVGLRVPVVYGPGRETGLTAAPALAARAAVQDGSFVFNFSGDVTLVFVEDVARAFVRAALEVDKGCHAVDLPGTTTSVPELIQMLDRLQPGAAKRLKMDGPSLPYPVAPQLSPLEKLFSDWKVIGLEEGLRKTMEFYRG